jgi:hypothetical protein
MMQEGEHCGAIGLGQCIRHHCMPRDRLHLSAPSRVAIWTSNDSSLSGAISPSRAAAAPARHVAEGYGCGAQPGSVSCRV